MSFADAEHVGSLSRPPRALSDRDGTGDLLEGPGSVSRLNDDFNFRGLLEKHEFAGGILQVINGYLADRGL